MSSCDGGTKFVEPGAVEGAVLVISAFLIMFFATGVWYTNGIFVTAWMDYFQTGSGMTSWLGTVMPAASIIMSCVSNILIRRFDQRLVCALSFGLAGSAIALSSMSQSIYAILGTWLFAGVSMAPTIFVFSYIVTRFKKYRSIANGLVGAGTSVSTFIYPVILNYTLYEYGWRGSVLIIGGVTLNLVPLSLLLRNWTNSKVKNNILPLETTEDSELILTKTSKQHKPNFQQLMQIDLFKKRVFNAIMIHALLYYMAVSLVYIHIVAGSRDLLGVTTEQARFTLTALGVTNLLGRLLVSILSQIPRVDVFTLYIITCLIVGATAGVLPLFKGFDAAMVLSALFGLGLSGYGCLIQLVLTDILGVNCVHMAFSYIQVTGGIGYVLGAPLAGWLYDLTGNYAYSFYLGTGLAGISVIVVIPDWFIHIRRR